MEGKDSEELANFTRKDKAERFLNKLFKGLKEAFRNSPHAEMLEEGDRHFKVKIGRVTFDYYILEREI